MDVGDLKDKFSSFFRITSKILGPYLRLKYEPKPKKSLEDYLLHATVFVGSWVFVCAVYITFVYLWVFEKPTGGSGLLQDFFTRPPVEIFTDVFTAFKVSPFFNLSFLVLMYLAVTFHAEKTFLEGRFVHLKLSGLIKTLTLGRFDSSSQVAEQEERQVQFARANIFSTVNDNTKELITIISASGWDMFGVSNVKPQPQTPSRWWSFLKRKPQNFENGYLLDVISERFRKVQIILVDPNGDGAKQRSEAYLQDGSHKVIKSLLDYSSGIEQVIKNIKAAYKKNKNIELKLVNSLPQWKMAIVEGETWVQPIIPGVRSDHTPLYGFKKVEYSMYHAFWHLAEVAWHDAKSVPVDLSK